MCTKSTLEKVEKQKKSVHHDPSLQLQQQVGYRNAPHQMYILKCI